MSKNTLQRNKKIWDGEYNWSEGGGDEWSAPWGNAFVQWHGTLLPRIQKFLPCKTICEIAPGFGRWTQFLKDQCENLVLIDLSQECIDACKKRFNDSTNIEYFVNDGKSLEALDDGSVDFLFTYDSLVHAEFDVFESYLPQISKKLSSSGVAFIHHSNIGEYNLYFKIVEALPKHLKNLLKRFRLVDPDHFRANNMTAKKFRDLAEKSGLIIVSQEIHNWAGGNFQWQASSKRLIDSTSIVARKDSTLKFQTKIFENPTYANEAEYLKRIVDNYA